MVAIDRELSNLFLWDYFGCESAKLCEGVHWFFNRFMNGNIAEIGDLD